MEIVATRSIDPESLQIQVSVLAEDIQKAFANAADPDEALYYALFGPLWGKMSDAEKLDSLAQLAQLVAESAAAAVTVAFGNPEPKE